MLNPSLTKQSSLIGCSHSRPALQRSIHTALAALQTGELRRSHLHRHIETSRALRALLQSSLHEEHLDDDAPLDVAAATAQLGIQTLVGLTVTDAVKAKFSGPGMAFYGHGPGGLLTHSLGVAHTSWAICELLGRDLSDCGVAYVAGLFRAIGKVEVARQLNEHRPEAANVSSVPRDAERLAHLEQSAVGFCHREVGASITSHWGLSERVHSLVAPTRFDDAPSVLEQVLHVADQMVTAIGIGYLDNPGQVQPFGSTRYQHLGHDRPSKLLAKALLERCQRAALRECARAIQIVRHIGRA